MPTSGLRPASCVLGFGIASPISRCVLNEGQVLPSFGHRSYQGPQHWQQEAIYNVSYDIRDAAKLLGEECCPKTYLRERAYRSKLSGFDGGC